MVDAESSAQGDPVPLSADDLRRLSGKHLPASVCRCEPQPCHTGALVTEIERLRNALRAVADQLAESGGASDNRRAIAVARDTALAAIGADAERGRV